MRPWMRCRGFITIRWRIFCWARVGGDAGIRAGGRGVPRGHFVQSEFSGSAHAAGRFAREAARRRGIGTRASALARRMRGGRTGLPVCTAPCERRSDVPFTANTTEMPPLAECLVVVTGLPRSGTSMLMQMLAAGGMTGISDGLRAADEDNPRGYLEFEPVKNLLKDAKFLFAGRGKASRLSRRCWPPCRRVWPAG
jgi:hypothetical protein